MKIFFSFFIFCLSTVQLFSQTCNPNGCPNLIVNGDFNSGHTGFTSSEIYNTVGTSPAANHYYISNDAYVVYGNWCGVSPDGTDFMIVDGSNTIAPTVWAQTVPGIQPTTGYNFCLLGTNIDIVHSFAMPDLTVLITDQNNDTLLFQGTGQIVPQNSQVPPVYIWTAYNFSFTSLASSSSFNVLISEATVNSSGHDFGLEDITLYEASCTGLPVVSFVGTEQICPGTCTNFTNLTTNATSYQWNFSGALPSSSTDADPQNICYNAPGSYDVTLVAFNANGSNAFTATGYVTVYPYPPPQGIAQSGDTLFANTGAVTYQWYFNGTIINGATNYYYLAAQNGNYNVVCMDSNDCEVEAVIFDVVAAVPDEIKNSGFEIFQNQLTGELKITNANYKIENLRILNLVGETVLNFTSLPASADISSLAHGYYILEARSGNNIYRCKFLKQ